MKTVAQITGQTPHFSFLWLRLERLAGARAVHTWLIDEANRRGFFGAFNSDRPEGAPATSLSLEELIVALLMPHADADARTWKLVVRMLQRAPYDPHRLLQLARMERAERLLFWLVNVVPESETTAAIAALVEQLKPPRGNRPIAYDFDASRLIRRQATREQLWHLKPS